MRLQRRRRPKATSGLHAQKAAISLADILLELGGNRGNGWGRGRRALLETAGADEACLLRQEWTLLTREARLLRLLESRRPWETRLLRLLETSWPLAWIAGGLRCDPTARLEALLELLWIVPRLHGVLKALLAPLCHEDWASTWKWWMVEVKERREPGVVAVASARLFTQYVTSVTLHSSPYLSFSSERSLTYA